MDPDPEELRAFAEDPGAYVVVGPDEERILTDDACVTFSPGAHFWSTSVQRVRFRTDQGGVDVGVGRIRARMMERGRYEAAWMIGPSATPGDLVARLLDLGMEAESDEGSVIMVLTDPPEPKVSAFDVKLVSSYEDHLSTIEVGIEGFGWTEHDAHDERHRARDTYHAERAGRHNARLLALDGDLPVATGTAWFSPFGLYLGGGATIPSHRRRGAMSALLAEAWQEAVRRGAPALVTFGGEMSAPVLEKMGFRPMGRVRHLIDRLDR